MSRKIVLGIGIFAIVMGCLTAFLGNQKSGGGKIDQEKMPKGDDGSSFQANAAVGGLIMTGGVLSILVGALGVAAAKVTKFHYTCPFITCSFIVGAYMASLAMVGFTVSGYTTQVIKYTCLANKFTTLDDDYKLLIDRYMCSSQCPCPSSAESKWSDVSESTLKKYTRVKTGADLTDTQFMDGTTLVPLKFASDQTFDTYKECFNKVLKAKFKEQADSDKSEGGFGEKAGTLLADTGFIFLEGLESIGDCASICKTPLFYLTQSVSEGPVKRNCMGALKDELSFIPVSAIAGLTAMVLFAGLILGMPICSGFNKEEAGEEGGAAGESELPAAAKGEENPVV